MCPKNCRSKRYGHDAESLGLKELHGSSYFFFLQLCYLLFYAIIWPLIPSLLICSTFNALTLHYTHIKSEYIKATNMKILETEEGRQLIEPFLDSDKNGMSKEKRWLTAPRPSTWDMRHQKDTSIIEVRTKSKINVANKHRKTCLFSRKCSLENESFCRKRYLSKQTEHKYLGFI